MFLEWLEQKKINEASYRNAMSHVSHAGLSEEGFHRDYEAGVQYIVVTNAVGMLKDALKVAGTEQKINPQEYSTYTISDVQGDQAVGIRSNGGGGKLSGNKTTNLRKKTFNLEDIQEFEITDAIRIDDNMLLVNKNCRYFLAPLPKAIDTVRKLMPMWLQSTKDQVLSTRDDRQDAGMLGLLSGDDGRNQLVRDRMNKGAKEKKDMMWASFGERALRGEDVTSMAVDAAIDDTNGYNALQNPKFQQKLMHLAPALYTQLKLRGQLGPVPPEDALLAKNLRVLDGIARSGRADEIMNGNPEADTITKNPMSIMYAQVLGYRNAAQWLKQRSASGGPDLFARMQAQNQQMAQPAPEPSQGMQQNPEFAKFLAIGAESCFYENICWKRHNDNKLYRRYMP